MLIILCIYMPVAVSSIVLDGSIKGSNLRVTNPGNVLNRVWRRGYHCVTDLSSSCPSIGEQ